MSSEMSMALAACLDSGRSKPLYYMLLPLGGAMKRSISVILAIVLFFGIGFLYSQHRANAFAGLKTGNTAPDFTLQSSSGEPFTLSKALGKTSIVLFFYPKDFSPGCTTEVCTFRDAYSVFKEAGAEVIGISSDSIESHKGFIKEHKLPFKLLSDEKGEVRKLYKIKSSGGLIPGRVTFVLDKKGVIQYMFSSQLEAKRHVEETLKIVRNNKGR